MFATRTADSDRRYESFWHASSPHRTDSDAWDIERTNADVPDGGQKQHRSSSARAAMAGRMVDGQAKCGGGRRRNGHSCRDDGSLGILPIETHD
jgi:hypothetical protein